jgi:cardiolipin synthase
VECIDKAQKQIQIVNPYFTLNKKVKRALKRALERGVDIQVMVSEKSDITIVPRIVEYNTNQLMKRGAQIFVYQGGFHHTKIMMVDSLFSYVGSANLNSRSLRYDYECNLLIADKYTTEELQLLFEVLM